MEILLTKVVLALSIGLQLFILIVLLRRPLQRRLFWFLTYIAYELIEAGLRFGAAGHGRLYFYLYWWTAVGGAILSVLAVRESFVNVFWMYGRFRWFTRIIWGCVGLALAYSVFRAWSSPPVRASRLGTVISDLELAVNYSLAFVGILYFALVKFEKVKQRQWESGVISGFSTIAVLSSIAVLTRFVFGPRTFNQWIEPAAYILAEIEWAVVLSRPEREAPKWIREKKLAVDDLTRFDEYITVLERLLGRRR